VSRRVRVVEASTLQGVIDRVRSDQVFNLGEKEGLLFLKPPDGERALLPVLGFKADFGEERLRVRLALFTFDDESAEPVAIGFRFETPEGPGRHNYHHVQITRYFEKDSAPLRGMPEWFPESQPAFLISARTPYALFFAVLIGLYGLDTVEKEWSEQGIRQHLQEDLLELRHGCGAPRC
jgi:hypothetical protein